ncbi:MAG: hypothetical protein K8H87_19455 [Pseudorhodoplanes sp.]|nr:hypothetical protein [Pseudorhodoplanes sp.]
MSHPILTEADFRRERTTRELRAWVDSYLEGQRETRDGVRTLRFDKGLNKRMKEEVLPVLRMLERAMSAVNVTVAFPVDSGAADATMRIGSGPAIPLQATCDFSYEEQLRLELLHQQGTAPGFGAIRKVKGQIHAVREAYSTEQAIADFSSRLVDRIKQKLRHRPAKGTWLVVQCIDEALPDSAIDPVIEASAQAAAGSPYARVFIVGTVEGRKLCRELRTIKPPATSDTPRP